MIQKIRQIVHFIIAFFSDYISLVCRPLVYQMQYQHFRRELKYKKKDNDLIILGNGPSFNLIEEHLSKLNDYDFCAVNLSVNTDIFFRLKPTMYVIVDMIFWQQPNLKKIKNAWENIQKINWDIMILLPFNAPNSIKKTFEANPHVKVCRYANNQWDPELPMANHLKMWLYKKGWVSPNGTNVSIGAIYCSMLYGYKNINLLGLEHSWMKDIRVNDKNEVVLLDHHYYGDTEHVWKDYEGNPIHLTDFIASQLATFSGHMYLQEFANYLGDVRIINRTKNSFIDAYERGSFNDLLK